ncbi:MAG: transporter substrate-binding domain-containing protein [Thermodesulfobacteriota bacterium]
MQRLWFLLVLLLGFGPSLAIPAEEPWAPGVKKIKDRGKLVVAQLKGVRPGFFGYDDHNRSPESASVTMDGKRLTGFDIELAKGIAGVLGVELVLDRTPATFIDVCRYVALGRADVGISKITMTPYRAQFVRFTQPYARLRTGLIINRLRESKSGRRVNLRTMTGLAGAEIGCIQGTSFEELGKKIFHQSKMKDFPDETTMMDALKAGQMLAVYFDEFEIKRRLKENPELNLHLRFEALPGKDDHKCLVVAPNNPDLLEFLNIFLIQRGILYDADTILASYYTTP